MPKKIPAILVMLAVLAMVLMTAPALQAAVIAPAHEQGRSVARITIAGYGRDTIGGSSGRRIWVTNLRDDGPGSLRAALEASGARLIQFRVSGTVVLQEPIKIKHPYVTVAGNVAPARGIQIRGASIIVMTHDVILRHLRVRPGDVGLTVGQASEYDAVTLNGVGRNVYNVVLDHLSLLWGPDIGGLAVLGNVHDVTIQNSIIGEGLRYSRHPEARGGDGHSMAVNVTSMNRGQAAPSRITFYHNLLTTSRVRMPRVIAASCVDFVNNLVYNWGSRAGLGNPRSMNMIANWFRRGPQMVSRYTWWPNPGTVAPTKYPDSVYMKGNHNDGFAGRGFPDAVVYASSARCGGSSVTPGPATSVYSFVLNNVGVRLPALDSVDARVIRNVRLRLGAYVNGVDFNAPHPRWPSLSE